MKRLIKNTTYFLIGFALIACLLIAGTAIGCEEEKCNDKVSMTMNVDNPEGELSNLCHITNGVGYRNIIGGLSVIDSLFIWRDLTILKEMFGINRVVVFINSGGGGASAGLAIADIIHSFVEQGMEIEGLANGMVASAAIPVFASCSKRIALRNCTFMVHKSKLFKYFSEESMDDLAAQQEMMQLIRDQYLGILADRSALSKDEWKDKILKTSWFTARQALKWGLVDEIR